MFASSTSEGGAKPPPLAQGASGHAAGRLHRARRSPVGERRTLHLRRHPVCCSAALATLDHARADCAPTPRMGERCWRGAAPGERHRRSARPRPGPDAGSTWWRARSREPSPSGASPGRRLLGGLLPAVAGRTLRLARRGVDSLDFDTLAMWTPAWRALGALNRWRSPPRSCRFATHRRTCGRRAPGDRGLHPPVSFARSRYHPPAGRDLLCAVTPTRLLPDISAGAPQAVFSWAGNPAPAAAPFRRALGGERTAMPPSGSRVPHFGMVARLARGRRGCRSGLANYLAPTLPRVNRKSAPSPAYTAQAGHGASAPRPWRSFTRTRRFPGQHSGWGFLGYRRAAFAAGPVIVLVEDLGWRLSRRPHDPFRAGGRRGCGLPWGRPPSYAQWFSIATTILVAWYEISATYRLCPYSRSSSTASPTAGIPR